MTTGRHGRTLRSPATMFALSMPITIVDSQVHLWAADTPARPWPNQDAENPYLHRGLHRYLHRMYDAFGPKRLYWGSDLTRMPCSYSLCVRLFTEELR